MRKTPLEIMILNNSGALEDYVRNALPSYCNYAFEDYNNLGMTVTTWNITFNKDGTAVLTLETENANKR